MARILSALAVALLLASSAQAQVMVYPGRPYRTAVVAPVYARPAYVRPTVFGAYRPTVGVSGARYSGGYVGARSYGYRGGSVAVGGYRGYRGGAVAVRGYRR